MVPADITMFFNWLRRVTSLFLAHLMFDLVITVLGLQDQTIGLYHGGENGDYGHRRCGKLEFKL